MTSRQFSFTFVVLACLAAGIPGVARAQNGPSEPSGTASSSDPDDSGQSANSSPVAPKPARPAIVQTFTTGENTWYHPQTSGSDLSVSERINQSLPKWIRFTGELRERWEDTQNQSFKPANSDDYVLDRLRIGMLLTATDWLRFYGEMQDARVWAKSPHLPPYQNTFDVRQAWAQLGSGEGSGLGGNITVGRMEMNYGNGRLVGNSWWTNVSRSFDGVKGTVRYGADKIDLFVTSVVIVRDGVIDHHNQGNNLSGIYTHFENVWPVSIVEPYGFWRVQPDAALKNGKKGHLDEFTYGVRFLGNLPYHFDYRSEMAIQRGTLGGATISSRLGHWTLGYSVPNVWWKPRIFAEYDYGSGDPNPKDLTHYNTFDPIYPSTHDKLGLADQIGWRNIKDARLGQEYHITRKFTAATSEHDFWLADAKDSLYPTRGSVVAKDPTGKSGTHVGWEFDVQGVYRITPQFQAGAGYGRLFTGHFLNKTTSGKDYNIPYIFGEYVF